MDPDLDTPKSKPYGEPWLTSFLRRQAQEGPHGHWLRLQLFHLPSRFGVRSWPIDLEQLADENLAALQTDILETAQAHASQLFGRQRYTIAAYHSERPSETSESVAFIRDGGGSAVEGEDDPGSESPSARGLLGQLMRHNEANMRTFQTGVVDLLKAQSRMIAEISDLNRHYHDKHFANLALTETLLSQSEERKAAADEAKLKQKMWWDGFQKIAVLAPVVVNKLAGAPILPQPTSVLKELQGNVIGSLRPDQLESMLGVLDPEQVVAITHLIEERRKLEAKQQESAVKALPDPSANGISKVTI